MTTKRFCKYGHDTHKIPRLKYGACRICAQNQTTLYKIMNRKQVNEWARTYQRKIGQILIKYKNKPCYDCQGWFEPCQMDFDHVRGKKEFNLSHSSSVGNIAKIKKEIDKCQVVCSNCHRLRTYKRSH